MRRSALPPFLPSQQVPVILLQISVGYMPSVIFKDPAVLKGVLCISHMSQKHCYQGTYTVVNKKSLQTVQLALDHPLILLQRIDIKHRERKRGQDVENVKIVVFPTATIADTACM